MKQEICPEIQKRLHNIQCSLLSFTSVFSLPRIRPDSGNRGIDNTGPTGSAHNHLHPCSCRTDKLHILRHKYKRYMSHSFPVLFLFHGFLSSLIFSPALSAEISFGLPVLRALLRYFPALPGFLSVPGRKGAFYYIYNSCHSHSR